MKPEERLKRIRDLFNQALERDPSEWNTFLEEACPDNPDLRRKIVALLSPLEEEDTREEDNGTLVPQILPESRPFSLVGKRLGAYWVMRIQGTDEIGTLYETMDTDADETVVIRSIEPRLTKDIGFMARFEAEAKALEGLENSHVLSVKTIEGEESDFLVVMEDVMASETLADYVQNKGLIGWQDASVLFPQLLDAFSAIHEVDVVHRDVRPSNILIQRNEDGSWMSKLANFGWTRLPHSSATLPQMGEELLHYLAQEQFTDLKKVDHRADLYGLGVTFREVLETDENVPASFTAFIKKATSQNVSKRFQSAVEMREAFMDVVTGASEELAEPIIEAPTILEEIGMETAMEFPTEFDIEQSIQVPAPPPEVEEVADVTIEAEETETSEILPAVAVAVGAAALMDDKEEDSVEAEPVTPEPVEEIIVEVPAPPAKKKPTPKKRRPRKKKTPVAKAPKPTQTETPKPAPPVVASVVPDVPVKEHKPEKKAHKPALTVGADRPAQPPTREKKEEEKSILRYWPLLLLLFGLIGLIWLGPRIFSGSPQQTTLQVGQDDADQAGTTPSDDLTGLDPTQTDSAEAQDGLLGNSDETTDPTDDLTSTDTTPIEDLGEQDDPNATIQDTPPEVVADNVTDPTPSNQGQPDAGQPQQDAQQPPATTDSNTVQPPATTDSNTAQPQDNNANANNAGNPTDTQPQEDASTVPVRPPTQEDLSQNTTTTTAPPVPSVSLAEQVDPQLVGGYGVLQQRVRYPAIARRTGVEGDVIVEFTVNEKGKVEGPSVIKGLGPLFNREALRVVRTLKYVPGKQGGRPVPVRVRLPIQFRL